MKKIIDQLAYPSHITNERTEVLAWNKAAQEILFDFSSIPVQERYFIRLLFEDTEMRSVTGQSDGSPGYSYLHLYAGCR